MIFILTSTAHARIAVVGGVYSVRVRVHTPMYTMGLIYVTPPHLAHIYID